MELIISSRAHILDIIMISKIDYSFDNLRDTLPTGQSPKFLIRPITLSAKNW